MIFLIYQYLILVFQFLVYKFYHFLKFVLLFYSFFHVYVYLVYIWILFCKIYKIFLSGDHRMTFGWLLDDRRMTFGWLLDDLWMTRMMFFIVVIPKTRIVFISLWTLITTILLYNIIFNRWHIVVVGFISLYNLFFSIFNDWISTEVHARIFFIK